MSNPPVNPDFALLREVIRWARAEGWRPEHDGTHRSWHREIPGINYAGVETYLGSGQMHILTPDGGEHDLMPETVMRALDLLVALGMLPQRFSSAYRAGQIAACVHVIAAAAGGGDRG